MGLPRAPGLFSGRERKGMASESALLGPDPDGPGFSLYYAPWEEEGVIPLQ